MDIPSKPPLKQRWSSMPSLTAPSKVQSQFLSNLTTACRDTPWTHGAAHELIVIRPVSKQSFSFTDILSRNKILHWTKPVLRHVFLIILMICIHLLPLKCEVMLPYRLPRNGHSNSYYLGNMFWIKLRISNTSRLLCYFNDKCWDCSDQEWIKRDRDNDSQLLSMVKLAPLSYNGLWAGGPCKIRWHFRWRIPKSLSV